MSKKPAKVALITPVTDFCPPFWAFDMYRMGVYNGVHGVRSSIFFSGGSLIPKQRESLLNVALADPDMTHLLWMDSDLRFPPDTMARLLSHEEPLVCASYTERTPPHRPVAFSNPENFDERLYTTDDKHGLEEIYACGFGCVMMRREVPEAMQEPRFMVGWSQRSRAHVGEDMYFFHKMHAEVGVPLLLDHDLTRIMKHIGRQEFSNDLAVVLKAQREAADVGLQHVSGA